MHNSCSLNSTDNPYLGKKYCLGAIIIIKWKVFPKFIFEIFLVVEVFSISKGKLLNITLMKYVLQLCQ